ncbi:MAG TPA: ROK family protein, partial [Acidobacteriota bacterium]
MEWMVATDIGGTKVASALVSREGKISALHQEPISGTSLESSIEQLVQVYRQVSARRMGGNVVGWALDVPGIWDSGRQKVWAPNIPGWDWIPLGHLLAAKVSVPLFIESDRTAALLGEAWKGEGANCADFLLLIVGTGIGLGALSAGKVVSGAHAVGGAVGWFLLPALFGEEKNPLTWEEAAAGPAMAARYVRMTGTHADAKAVFLRAQRGEQAAREVVRQTAVYLGFGIANLIAAFDPELIVVSGGISRGFNLVEGTIRQTLDAFAHPISSKKVRLVKSKLGSEGPLLGLASMGF